MPFDNGSVASSKGDVGSREDGEDVCAGPMSFDVSVLVIVIGCYQ